MKTLALFFTVLTLSTHATDFDARAAFGSDPGHDIDTALKQAQKENKRVLVATYDTEGDYNNQGLQIKYFTDLKETKRLLQENFIVVLLDCNDIALAKYSEGINLERPHYFLLSATGDKIKDDTLCANPEDGLRRTKAIIATTEKEQWSQVAGKTVKTISITTDLVTWGEAESKKRGVSFSELIEKLMTDSRADKKNGSEN